MAHTSSLMAVLTLLLAASLSLGVSGAAVSPRLAQDIEEIAGAELDNRITEHCSLLNDTLECCIGVESQLNFTACISLEYLREEMGLDLKVKLDGFTIIERKVTVKNPPPVCFGVPYLEHIANACFRLYDLDLVDRKIKGCLDFEGHVEGLRVFKFDLGCIEVPIFLLNNKVRYELEDTQEY